MERRSSKTAENPVDAIIAAATAAVQKKFGSGNIATLNSSAEFAEVKTFVSFGHFGLDHICGGGLPTGRLTELYGAFSSGKSLLIAHLLANCQKMGGIAILDDCEHAYLKHFGELIGVDNSRLLYTASETVEEVFNKMESTLEAILAKNPDQLVVYAWDSVAAVSSIEEQSKDMGESQGYGTAKAKAITQGTRKIVGLIGKHNVALVVANQMKQNVGVMYGPTETTPGGDAIPFWASVRLRLGKGELIRKDGKATGEVVGVSCKAEAKKNKIVKPFQKTEFDILFDEGLIYTSGCVDALIAAELIEPIISEEKEGKPGQVSAARNTGYYHMLGSDKRWRKKELEEYFTEHPEELRTYMRGGD